MIISGNNLNYIYPQNKVNWSLNLKSIEDFSGKYFSFYFSGENKSLEIFKLKNNKIYDRDNYLIGNYFDNTQINFSGNISEDKFNLYKNNNLLFDGKEKINFNFNSFGLNSNGAFIDVQNLSILGIRPKFYINGTDSTNFTNQFNNSNIISYFYLDQNIPINIYNSGLNSINIYSGITTNQDFSILIPNTITISPSNSGYFTIINTGLVFGLSNLPIILYTNIGNLNLNLTVSGIQNNPEIYYFSFGPEITEIYDISSQNYNLTFFNKQTSFNLNVELNYVSGTTGELYSQIEYVNSINKLEQVSGFISGDGYLYSDLVTGIVQNFNSVVDEVNGVPFYYNKVETGFGSGYYSKYKYADDQLVTYIYEIEATGYGNGILLTTVSCSGYDEITYSGYLTYLGGYLTGYGCGFVSGIIPNEKRGWTYDEEGNFTPPQLQEKTVSLICKYRPELSICNETVAIYNYEYATGNICGQSIVYFPYTGKINAYYPNEDLIEIDIISPLITITGHFIGNLDITGIALATGGRVSGIAIGDFAKDIEPGFYNFYKDWGGILTGESFINWTGSGFNPTYVNSKNFDKFTGDNSFFSYIDGYEKQISTGFFTGLILNTGILNFCNPIIPNNITVSGIPLIIGEVGENIPNIVFTNQKQAFTIIPNLYLNEIKYENSDFRIASGNFVLHNEYPSGGRTLISRLGNTISGSGKFDNIFQIPNYSGIRYQKTGANGELLYKLKLDANGNPIIKYSNVYECMPLTGANGLPVTGADGNLITGSDGNFVPQPLIVNGNVIIQQKRDQNGNLLYDNNNLPILDYVCQPLTGADGKPVFLPSLDENNNIIYEKLPDIEYISKNFFGWSETLFVNTGIKYKNGIPPSIKNIDINCYLFDPCDVSIINFIVEKPNFYFSGIQDPGFECFTECFENWPKQSNFIETSGYISGYTSNYLRNISANIVSKFGICEPTLEPIDGNKKYFEIFNSDNLNESINENFIFDEQILITGNNFNGNYIISNIIDGKNYIKCLPSCKLESYMGESLIGSNQFSNFGRSLDINNENDILVVGAPKEDFESKKNVGYAYIYNRYYNNNWYFTKKISGLNLTSFGEFGQSVAIDNGNCIVVGEPFFRNQNQEFLPFNRGYGGVHIFTGQKENLEWNWDKSLHGFNIVGSEFGYSLDLNDDGNILIVGAPREINSNITGGAVYVYCKLPNGWKFDGRLTGNLNNSYFGQSVKINSGNKIIIKDNSFTYIYNYTGNILTLDYTLNNPINNHLTNNYSNKTIDTDLSNNFIILGFPYTGYGLAKLYNKNGNNWNLIKNFSGESGYFNYGTSVGLNIINKQIYIGSPNENMVYVYTGNNFIFSGKIGYNEFSLKDNSRCVSSFSGLGNCISVHENGNFSAFGGYLSGPNQEGRVLIR